MTSSLGPAAFFALEAGDCLDRLDALFRAPEGPAPEEFLRVSRVLRGSALMANQPQLARAAAGFEALARARRDGVRSWDTATQEQAAHAVEEFRVLVRRVPDWQESDAARAARLAAHLESLAGQGPAEAARIRREGVTPSDLQTGVRAFVAREGALIASALDRAARAFRAAPDDREPLSMVLRRMQSIQGLAELPDLPPLGDILDGIELAVGDLSRLHAPPPGVDELLAAGALALSRVARDIAELGIPTADAPEPRRFTELLVEKFAVEHDVVPIESLFVSGDPTPIQRPPSLPAFAPPAPPGSLELISLGEHLVQTAGLIEQARSATELDLRLYRLVGTLRAAAIPHTDPIGNALGVLARAGRECIAVGAVKRDRGGFTAALRQLGELLRASGGADDRMYVSRRILDAAHQLDLFRDATSETPVVPIESLAYDDQPPIAAAPSPSATAAPSPTAAPTSAAPPAEERSRLETAFATYGALIRTQGLGEPSLEALLGRAATAPEPVPIASLCYRGRAALLRADEVSRLLREQMTDGRDPTALEPLIRELVDLVPLALAETD